MVAIPVSRDEWSVERLVALLDAHVYENSRLEWKEDIVPGGGDRTVQCAAAMANSEGGFIVVGVTDSRSLPAVQRLVGVDATRDMSQQIGELLKNADPAIPHQLRNPPLLVPARQGRVIPVLEVFAGIGPHSYKGAFYRRDGSNLRPSTTTEVREMFNRREELLRRARLLVLELVSAREAALGITLVTSNRRTTFLRAIDTRMIAELHAAILPLLADDEELSSQLTTLRGQGEILNFRLHSILPRFYQPAMEEKYAALDFDVFIDVNSDAHRYTQRLERAITRLCERASISPPKLLQDYELRDRGAF